CHFQCLFAVFRAGTNNGTRIVDCYGGPMAELLLGKTEPVAHYRKNKQRNDIQQKHGARCNGKLIGIGFDRRPHGGYCTPTADGRAHRNQEGGDLVDFQKNTECKTDSHGAEYKSGSDTNILLPGTEQHIDVYAETKPNDRSFEQVAMPRRYKILERSANRYRKQQP